MKEIKILHTADIHLDRRFKGFPGVKGTKRRLDIRETFIRIMQLALKESVHIVVIAGDLFDNNNPSLGTIETVKKQFELMGKQGVPVLITPGTHDCLEADSVWDREKFPDNVHIFKSPLLTRKDFPDLNLSVFGAANESANMNRHILRDVRIDHENSFANKLIAVHGSVPLEWAKNDNYFPISIEEIEASGVDYVALGHYHSYYPFQTKVRASYSGSPVLLDFEDRKDKYVLIVTMKDNVVAVDPCKIEQKYEMKDMDIDSSQLFSAEDIVEQLKPFEDAGRIIRVNLQNSLPINTDIDGIIKQAEKYYAEEAVFLNIIFNDRTKLIQRKQIDEKTVKGLFMKKMQGKIDSLPDSEKQFYELALHLGVKAIDEGKL